MSPATCPAALTSVRSTAGRVTPLPPPDTITWGGAAGSYPLPPFTTLKGLMNPLSEIKAFPPFPTSAPDPFPIIETSGPVVRPVVGFNTDGVYPAPTIWGAIRPTPVPSNTARKLAS